MESELFELELLGGAIERRYRKMRPEVAEMPWGTLDLSLYSPESLIAGRRSWTGAAFQEHRTAAACALTLRALIECRAPIDLIAAFSKFPLDEVLHVELCARMAMELGGGTEIQHDPAGLVADADRALPALWRAAELVTRNFCVGEALSIPLLHGTWQAASHPLPRAVLGRIVKDEAAHGVYGFTFLDWALPNLDAAALDHLRVTAQGTITAIHRTWADIRKRPKVEKSDGHALGWMESDAYLALADRSLRERVVKPLRARGIMVVAEDA